MHPATGWEIPATDHPALNLNAARENITVQPGNAAITPASQRPCSVKFAASSAVATRLLAQGY